MVGSLWLSLGVSQAHALAISASSGVTVFAEPQSGVAPVLRLIRSARHLIRLEVYELTDRDVINALDSARHRGVSVQVLLEQHPYSGGSYDQEAYQELRSDGISTRWANEAAFTYTHEKAMDVDNKIAGIFTFNLSYSAFESNREFGVVYPNPSDATAIGSIFQADWNRRQARLSNSQLVVSPINARSTLTHLIDGAHHTLDLYEEEMDDGSIESHVVQAVHRHVRVRLITSTGSAGVARLEGSGVHVVVMSSPYVHAKAIVADGNRVFIGSENISSTSLDSNREMGIVLTQSNAIHTVEATFQSDLKAYHVTKPPRHGGKLTLSLTATPASVARYQPLTISAHTTVSASCTITVTYPDAYVSHASTLQGSRTADSSGQVNWSWHVGSTVTGTAHAGVSCTLGSKSASKTVAFIIRS